MPPLVHVVQPGEWLSKIAAAYGHCDWKRVWDAPENAALRKGRRDPNVLYPGDEIYIPPIQQKSVECVTDEAHVFVLKTPKKRLRIRLETTEGEPRRRVPCRLEIDEKVIPSVTETDGNGFIDAEIKNTAESGKLFVGRQYDEYYEVRLGHLDPVTTVRGYQQRLYNLAHYRGKVDGAEGPLTKAAVKNFQLRENLIGYSPPLKVDGVMGPKTTEALLRRHGY